METKKNLFWKLVETEHLKARAFCRKLTGNRDDGDDLYQDTLVAALLKFDNLREITAFRSWLYRIIINRYKNIIRQPLWKRLTSMSEEIEDSIGSNNPSAAYTARQRLEVAFKVLNPEEQALITLFEMEGWTISELAALYDKREGNIKVRLSRTRKKMRDAIIKHLSETGEQRTIKTLKSEVNICVATKPGKE